MKMEDLWTGKIVSFAYQYQKEARPFKEMMTDFARMITPKDSLSIMDIGCGSGRIIQLILDDIRLNPHSIAAIDISRHALNYAQKNISKFHHTCPITFHQKDISSPECFFAWEESSFDLITAGLSLQYAQYWDTNKQQWTTAAYERVLSSIYKLLKPGGQFVFSVNTPNPDFSIIAKESKKEILTPWWKIPFRLLVALIMVWQGRKLTREADKGRFNYLPIEQVYHFLTEAGFKDIQYTLTYAGLAWVVSCKK
jgi:SAM-dependent methyltransferase